MDSIRSYCWHFGKAHHARSSRWGIILTIVLGIVGAVVGGFIGTLLGFGGISGFDFRSLVIAVIGALIVLFVYGMFAGQNR